MLKYQKLMKKKFLMINIVLVEPRIPQNTGNIARVCVGLNASLHLIEPLGFTLSDKYVKRAGMDYWEKLDLYTYIDLEHFWQKHPFDDRHFLATTKIDKKYCDINYQKNDYIYFGREDAGLDENLIKKYKHQAITIPMSDNIRSINLANSVSIIAYEALRQNINEILL
jgi:tRNA (cytidine/uridine-2'-O-)-methyltransferase